MDDDPDPGFGGEWSLEKLDCLEDYLEAFVRALRVKFRVLMYVDAFAGKGWHRVRHATKPVSSDGPQHVIAEGSALRAMRPENRFDIYRFNDLDSQHVRELRNFIEQARKRLLPPVDARVEQTDANTFLLHVAEELKAARSRNQTRAVAMLDPFGMQVNWASLCALGSTHSVDVWYLVPLGAIARLAPRHGNVPHGWHLRMVTCFGDPDWQQYFYREDMTPDLFGANRRLERQVGMDVVIRFVEHRLKLAFPGGLARRPLLLGPARRAPLFGLFFAMANPEPKARAVAMRIANHLIERT